MSPRADADSQRIVSRDVVFPEPDFPLGVIRCRHESVARHRHEFSELVIITDGHGVHTTGQRQYAISAGDVFVIHGQRSHGYRVTKGLSLTNILFDLSRLRVPLMDLEALPGFHALFTCGPALHRQGRFGSRLKLPPKRLAEVTDMIVALDEEFTRRGPGWRFTAMSLFMQLIAFLCRCHSHAPVRETPRVDRLAHLASYIQKHYSESLTLEALAEHACMSVSTLLRTFKPIFGATPMDYVIRLRVQKASHLLRRSHQTVSEIARIVGFRDSNYFSRQFRSVTGMSPSRYRREAADWD